jgi:mono/diheme cytochrome c family protein
MRALELASILALTVLVACGDDSPAPTPPTPAASSTPPAPATPATPAPAPAASAACAVPEGSLRGDAKAGAVDYNQYCVLCHGAAAPPVQPKPADHKDCGYMNALTDAHVYSTICGGGAAVGKAATMPPWNGALTPDRIKNVIAHLRSFCPS